MTDEEHCHDLGAVRAAFSQGVTCRRYICLGVHWGSAPPGGQDLAAISGEWAGPSSAGADWPAIRDRAFGRIDPRPGRAVAHRRANGIDVFAGEARFLAPKILRVGDDEIRADRFVLATGSRPHVPPVPGLAEIPYRTSDDVMRLDTLPKSMAVLGGGYIAAEMSHVFGSLGTAVTIVERGQHLLSRHDADIRARFTGHYRERRSCWTRWRRSSPPPWRRLRRTPRTGRGPRWQSAVG